MYDFYINAMLTESAAVCGHVRQFESLALVGVSYVLYVLITKMKCTISAVNFVHGVFISTSEDKALSLI